MNTFYQYDNDGKPYPDVIKFKPNDILSLSTLGSQYDMGNLKVTFTAESDYRDLQRVKINSDVVLSLMQGGVSHYTDLVAKKSDKYWYISGDRS